jgi:hypothetical protein
VFEIGIDTQHFSRVLQVKSYRFFVSACRGDNRSAFQHVPKYESVTFFLAKKDEPQNLGILMIEQAKRIYNYTPIPGVIPGPEASMDEFSIPARHFKGFLEFSAYDFQQHIHELFQMATIVTFATNQVTTGAFASSHTAGRKTFG